MNPVSVSLSALLRLLGMSRAPALRGPAASLTDTPLARSTWDGHYVPDYDVRDSTDARYGGEKNNTRNPRTEPIPHGALFSSLLLDSVQGGYAWGVQAGLQH
eukprot:6755493-Prymnesium_polylepis.1